MIDLDNKGGWVEYKSSTILYRGLRIISGNDELSRGLC